MSEVLPDKVRSAFLSLVRAGLWERDVDDLSAFPLSAEKWKAVFAASVLQTVTGIAYRGLHHIPDNCLPPLDLMCRWAAAAERVERNNRLMNGTLAELTGLFNKHGIWAVLQKGQGIAGMYEYPLLRECGDIDLFFPEKSDFNLACDIVGESGSTVKRASDHACHYRWNGISVEHHLTLFDMYNPFMQGFLSNLIERKGFTAVEIPTEDGFVSVSVASPVLTLFMLSTHILKHTLGAGVGLRQFCDMARACHCLHDLVDGDELRNVFQKTGLYKWNNLLLAFLTEHLALDSAALLYECRPDKNTGKLLSFVLQTGNFGSEGYKHSNVGDAAWRHKMDTMCSFFRHGTFPMRYAASESFWIFSKLLLGQIK
ncbi:MAG: nucleotidyltransferase family protein [Bacteroides sp.]|nr:nucleotidyltransferase family protein [Roseburia sp.]MCM1346004.1 nucleotidyltransferase family protein [Bacteroides sp.]MCM1420837.1 nucleotidyltransferase family protein [Bacteroides sp.]